VFVESQGLFVFGLVHIGKRFLLYNEKKRIRVQGESQESEGLFVFGLVHIGKRFLLYNEKKRIRVQKKSRTCYFPSPPV